jgi:hypothetical protein
LLFDHVSLHFLDSLHCSNMCFSSSSPPHRGHLPFSKPIWPCVYSYSDHLPEMTGGPGDSDSDSYLLTYGAEPFLRRRQLCSPSRTPQHFMEPEDSIPCSQDDSNGRYPEPYQSNPIHPISLRSILILSTHLRLGPVHTIPSWNIFIL